MVSSFAGQAFSRRTEFRGALARSFREPGSRCEGTSKDECL